MLNFTVGPVQSPAQVCTIGGEQVPYFRTAEFSEMMLENERLTLEFARAQKGARAVFLTASGTGAMEAAVANALTEKDKVLVVNGGSFGQRFVELLRIHGIQYTEIVPPPWNSVTEEQLSAYDNKGYTAFLVNLHETSVGVLHDIDLISDFCKRNSMLLVADAISSFIVDPFDMNELGVDIMITGSQKALACPPGVSIVVLSPRALKRVEENDSHCMYLDLRSALRDQERGQTPFTPAVGILRQINIRLKGISESGGVENETERISRLAHYFRAKLWGLPLEICSMRMSNAATPIHPIRKNAHEIFLRLKDEYGIWVCPNGGELKDKLFRVGHIGALSTADYDKLIDAFTNLKLRGVI